MKESYESMKTLLETIEYSKYSWNICGDLKVISLLLGLLGATQSICVFYVFGIVVTTAITILKLFSLREKSLQLVSIT